MATATEDDSSVASLEAWRPRYVSGPQPEAGTKLDAGVQVESMANIRIGLAVIVVRDVLFVASGTLAGGL